MPRLRKHEGFYIWSLERSKTLIGKKITTKQLSGSLASLFLKYVFAFEHRISQMNSTCRLFLPVEHPQMKFKLNHSRNQWSTANRQRRIERLEAKIRKRKQNWLKRFAQTVRWPRNAYKRRSRGQSSKRLLLERHPGQPSRLLAAQSAPPPLLSLRTSFAGTLCSRAII